MALFGDWSERQAEEAQHGAPPLPRAGRFTPSPVSNLLSGNGWFGRFQSGMRSGAADGGLSLALERDDRARLGSGMAPTKRALHANTSTGWWAQEDLNLRPSDYEPVALTN